MPLERLPRPEVYSVPWLISDDIVDDSSTSSGSGEGPVDVIVVTISPHTATLGAGETITFTSTVTGTFNDGLYWSVNGTDGGGGLLGTVSALGEYVASADAERPATVTIRARSVVQQDSYDEAVMTLLSIPVGVSITPGTGTTTGTDPFPLVATVTGTSNQGVHWYVNGISGGNPSIGTISPEGIYQVPGTVGQPPTVTIKAVSVVNPSAFDEATLTLPPVVVPPVVTDPTYDPNNVLPTGTCNSGTIQVVKSAYVWGAEALPNPNVALTQEQIDCHVALFNIEVAEAKAQLEAAGNTVTVIAGQKWHQYSDEGTYLGMGAKTTCDPHNSSDDHYYALSGYITITQALCVVPN